MKSHCMLADSAVEHGALGMVTARLIAHYHAPFHWRRFKPKRAIFTARARYRSSILRVIPKCGALLAACPRGARSEMLIFSGALTFSALLFRRQQRHRRANGAPKSSRFSSLEALEAQSCRWKRLALRISQRLAAMLHCRARSKADAALRPKQGA